MKNMVVKELNYQGVTLQIVRGDITMEEVDAIVNAANSHLQHGGGIAGAIVRRGGREIQDESNRIGFVPTGQAVVTGAGRLPAKYVIHAVGPIWGEGNEEQKLRNAVTHALEQASKLGIRSISIPAISSGIFGYPKKEACKVIWDAVRTFIDNNTTGLDTIRLCAIDSQTVGAFMNASEV